MLDLAVPRAVDIVREVVLILPTEDAAEDTGVTSRDPDKPDDVTSFVGLEADPLRATEVPGTTDVSFLSS